MLPSITRIPDGPRDNVSDPVIIGGPLGVSVEEPTSMAEGSPVKTSPGAIEYVCNDAVFELVVIVGSARDVVLESTTNTPDGPRERVSDPMVTGGPLGVSVAEPTSMEDGLPVRTRSGSTV